MSIKHLKMKKKTLYYFQNSRKPLSGFPKATEVLERFLSPATMEPSNLYSITVAETQRRIRAICTRGKKCSSETVLRISAIFVRK